MASVTGPLMSFDASGTVAGSVVFSRWKGRNYVRRHAIPSNPQSGKQRSVRAMLKFLAQQWAGLSAPDKATWEAIADSAKISPFNAYVAGNQDRWFTFRTPTKATPPAGTSTPADAPTVVATGTKGMITLTITDGVQAPDWGWIIFRRLGGAPSMTWDEVTMVAPYSASPSTIIDSPLAPGTWHYRLYGFNTDGVSGSVSADASDAVT